MKKVLLVLVVLAMMATPAMAEVKGSKHDLSSASGAANTFKDTATGPGTEICVFCHTPHNAQYVADKYLPLWNRSVVSVSVTSVYNTSSTLSAEARAVTTDDVANIDAALCLSCHDGASLSDPLKNPSNVDGAPTVAVMTGNAVLDGAFNNDHPVAFSYKLAEADPDESELVAFNTVSGQLPFFGTGGDELWCSTCHDVHMGETNFMVKSNTASALCLTCHIK